MEFVFSVIKDNTYDIDSIFDDPIEAIKMALQGQEIAVLDSLSLEYYGSI